MNFPLTPECQIGNDPTWRRRRDDRTTRLKVICRLREIQLNRNQTGAAAASKKMGMRLLVTPRSWNPPRQSQFATVHSRMRTETPALRCIAVMRRAGEFMLDQSQSGGSREVGIILSRLIAQNLPSQGFRVLIGVPKEIKTHEYRVGMVPANVREATSIGHRVLVETSAGARQGLTDEDYRAAGATIVGTAQEVFAQADLIVKVKEPQAAEIRMLRAGQTIFTYLHLAADAQLTQGLLGAGVTAIAYETVTGARGGLPLLSPMSEVAGRMAVQVGARCLEMAQGGRGVLLGGTASVAPAKVAILGAGVAGLNAVRAAVGAEARVTCLDIDLNRISELDQRFGATLTTLLSTRQAVEDAVLEADLVICSVLVPGAATPKLISTSLVQAMKRGSVIVDISIDQGGCAETSKPTSHAAPTYVDHGVVHYCVTNMPGAVARTSTIALNNATLPFVLALAGKGVLAALREDPHLQNGLNVHDGRVTHPAVAKALGLELISAAEAVSRGWR